MGVFIPIQYHIASYLLIQKMAALNSRPKRLALPRTDPSYHIAKPVIALHESAPVSEALELMNDKKISSILLHNDKEKIVGILTERDVIRKLIPLDVEDKFERQVGLIATREVYFADLNRLHESVVRLHFEKKIRHFPVLRGNLATLENVVGMVTVTDIIRHYLNIEFKDKTPTKRKDPNLHPLSVICKQPNQMEFYEAQFGKVKFEVTRVSDPAKFFRENARGDIPLIFDFDGYPQKELSNLIVQAKKYSGHLIMTVSDPGIVTLFRRYLDKQRQTIALKPLDTDYLIWLLTSKWHQIYPQTASKV